MNNTAKQLMELLGSKHEITIMSDIVNGLNFEYEQLQQENKELTRLVANKVVADYDYDSILKKQLNEERLKYISLEESKNRRNLKMEEKIKERIKKAEEELKEARKELKKYKESEHSIVSFGGYEWYVIAEDNDTKTLFMKDKLSENDIKGIFNKEYLDDYKDVRFSFHDNKWRDSIIRAVLNTEFLAQLDRSGLKPMTIDADGIETVDYVRLISLEEVQELPAEIRKCNGNWGYWTLTPYSSNTYGVYSVHSSGDVGSNHAYNEYGVRPVIRVLKSAIESV